MCDDLYLLNPVNSFSQSILFQPFGAVTMGTAGLVVIPIMVGISVFGSSTSSLLAGSRVTFSAARDGFLPSVFSQLHATYRTPLPAILAQVGL